MAASINIATVEGGYVCLADRKTAPEGAPQSARASWPLPSRVWCGVGLEGISCTPVAQLEAPVGPPCRRTLLSKHPQHKAVACSGFALARITFLSPAPASPADLALVIWDEACCPRGNADVGATVKHLGVSTGSLLTVVQLVLSICVATATCSVLPAEDTLWSPRQVTSTGAGGENERISTFGFSC